MVFFDFVFDFDCGGSYVVVLDVYVGLVYVLVWCSFVFEYGSGIDLVDCFDWIGWYCFLGGVGVYWFVE